MTRTTVFGALGAAAGVVVAVTLAAVALPRATAPAHPRPTPAVLDHRDHRSTSAVHDRAARTAADDLIRATRRNARRWADVDDATAAGYRSIGDGATGFEHYVHPQHLSDVTTLRPSRPEALVYRVDGQRRTYVSAMYILPPGAGMADVPDLGDDRARWHRHRDLCWDEQGHIAGLFRGGRCVPGGTRIVTPPMLHVWVTPHPCGPFAGLEGHGSGCH